MDQFSFKAAYQDRIKIVKIARISGHGYDGDFHIHIDGNYEGMIVRRSGAWEVREPAPRHTFSTEDIDILISRLDVYLTEKYL